MLAATWFASTVCRSHATINLICVCTWYFVWRSLIVIARCFSEKHIFCREELQTSCYLFFDNENNAAPYSFIVCWMLIIEISGVVDMLISLVGVILKYRFDFFTTNWLACTVIATAQTSPLQEHFVDSWEIAVVFLLYISTKQRSEHQVYPFGSLVHKAPRKQPILTSKLCAIYSALLCVINQCQIIFQEQNWFSTGVTRCHWTAISTPFPRPNSSTTIWTLEVFFPYEMSQECYSLRSRSQFILLNLVNLHHGRFPNFLGHVAVFAETAFVVLISVTAPFTTSSLLDCYHC